jgi:flagellar biogenesis protein FliO
VLGAGGASAPAQVLTVVLALVVVIGAIFLTYALARFLSAKGGFISGRHIKILDRVPMGRDKYLLIVSVQEKTFFIGVAENIAVLETWTDESAVWEKKPKEAPFAAIWSEFRLNRSGSAGKESESTDA